MESIYALLSFIPLSPIVVLSWLFYSPKFAIGAGILLFFGCWYLLQPSSELSDWHETVPDADQLAVDVHSLCAQLNAPRPHRIVLCNELNAFAHTSGGVLSLVGVKRTLGIGIPLLRILNADEVRAVIAHELGHFSRQHGRLGHWIYRVRAKWLGYAYSERDAEGIGGAIAALADRLVPPFLARSAEWSVHCEFEADASAASCVLGTALITGLTKLQAVDAAWKTSLADQRLAMMLASPLPPTDYWQWVTEAASRISADAAFNASAQAWRRSSGVHRISHPPIHERIEHVGSTRPTTLDWAGPCAGEVLLGNRWALVYASFAERTCARMSASWRVDHARLTWSQKVLAAATVPTNDAAVGDVDRITRLAAADHLFRNAETLNALANAASDANSAAAMFAYGSALLARDVDDGIEWLRKSYRADRTYALTATELMASHTFEFGTFEATLAARSTADAAREWARPFTENFRKHLLNDQLTAGNASFVTFAREVLLNEKRIDACWLVRFKSREINERSFGINVFVFRIVPDSASVEQHALDEDELVDGYLSLLTAAVPPNEMTRVAVYYTTEPIDPKLLRRFEETSGAEIVAPRAPINVNMLKFDQG